MVWGGVRRVVLAGALVVPLLGAAGVQATAATVSGTTSGVAGGDAGDLSPEAAASRQAAASGSPVEVSAETTPTQLVTAQPDGTFTVRFDPAPVRAKQASGWVPVDTSLERAPSGEIVPKAAAADVAFSGGGSGTPLASITKDGKTYRVHAPWSLPVPTLAGSAATYADVMPGTDLVVRATPDGFNENLVVKTRDAADRAELTSVRFPVSVDGVSARDTSSGGAAFVDAQERPVFTTGTALMYDSAAAPAPAQGASARTQRGIARAQTGPVAAVAAGAADGPTPGAHTTAMDVTVSNDELLLKPDRSFLEDPDTAYPVVLDPQTTKASLSGWTAVWSSSPSTSFWKTSHALGVGYDAWVDNKKVRSLYQFDTHSLGGKKILSATFTALEVWSANCTEMPVQLWRTGAISSSTTWSSQPSWSAQVDSVKAAKGYSSSCPGGNVSFDATSAVSYTAGQSASTTTLGLRADEGDPVAWKQFGSPSEYKPTLSVTFVSLPAVPTGVKMSSPSLACSTAYAGAVVIRDTTPTLAAAPKSGDGSQATLRPNFEIYKYDPNAADPLAGSGSPSAYTAAGTAGTWTAPTLTSGQTYWFRARTEYKYSFNGTTGYMRSGWSSPCWFKVDTTRPVQPDVDSTAYPQCASPDTPDDCTAQGGVGAAGPFTLKANGASDVVKYTFQLNDDPVQTKTFTTPTTTYTRSLAPDVRGVNSLTVNTWDSAGNESASYTYFFKVAPGAGPVDHWSMDEGTGSVAADSVAGKNATLHGSAAWTDQARLGKALQADGTSAYAVTGSSALDTTQSFTVSAWVRLNSLAANSTFLAQEGTNADGFQLYYSTAYGWVFNRHASDVTSPTIVRARSAVPPATGVWTHLLGVYHAQTQQIRLYVNGVNDPSLDASFTTSWKASGPLDIGRRLYQGSFGEYTNGSIDDVTLWNRILSPEEAADLQAMTDPATGQARPALAADWAMEETTGTSAADSSVYAHTAAVDAGGSWTTDTAGGKGNVLSLNGTPTASASAPGPIVDSQGDFTVTAWAKLDAAALSDTSVAHHMKIAGQSGSVRDAWGLWYEQAAGSTQGMWVFGRTLADNVAGPVATVPADAASAQLVDPGSWTLLTGVYDSAHHRMSLYVNGVRQGAQDDETSTDADTGHGGVISFAPWQATGAFNIGRGRSAKGVYDDYANSLVDDVRVWTGVLSSTAIDQMYLNEAPIPL
ncbi:LamG-like jellyroll fold domain-containing protein [Streptomyces sp. NPDC007070]|uniref:LamG-like jellyroll fold domain-containing protein n=1 Tax=Streptomyces sp. NPDC007070 TaxID=3154312 RepID=UPI0033CBDBEE